MNDKERWYYDQVFVRQERKLYELAALIDQGVITHEEATQKLIEYGKELMMFIPIVPVELPDVENPDHE